MALAVTDGGAGAVRPPRLIIARSELLRLVLSWLESAGRHAPCLRRAQRECAQASAPVRGNRCQDDLGAVLNRTAKAATLTMGCHVTPSLGAGMPLLRAAPQPATYPRAGSPARERRAGGASIAPAAGTERALPRRSCAAKVAGHLRSAAKHHWLRATCTCRSSRCELRVLVCARDWHRSRVEVDSAPVGERLRLASTWVWPQGGAAANGHSLALLASSWLESASAWT